MTIQKWPNLVEMFFDQEERYSKKPLLWHKENDKWQSLSWADTAQKIARLAQAMRNLGVKAGDRVVIVSENRPEWLIADMAIMTLGAITVPTYITYTSRDYSHILENSGACLALISTRNLAATFLKAAHLSPELTDAIVIEDPELEQVINVNLHPWDDVMAGPDVSVSDLRAAISAGREDIACLIYTSGTGGAPKGVMIHHGAILHNCEGASGVIEELGLDNNVFLSFLPLSHAYEHSAGQFLPLTVGAQIYYAEGLEKLASNMEETHPTIMVVVPRLFEMLRTKLLRAIAKEGGLKAKLFDQAIELGVRRQIDPKSLSLKEKAYDGLLTLLVRRKVQKRFGGRIKALVSGGAPLSPEIGHFFASLGLPLLQGYGQTESGPVISVNWPSNPQMHTVGKILANTQVRIAEDGEILVQGELVMKGYWRDKKETKKTIIDGWLHTGDIGEIDSDGNLVITDRKKDIIVNDKGDNVSPQRIEGLLSLEDEIAQAMVYGNQRPHLVGIIVPDADWLREWARDNGKANKLNELVTDPDLHKALNVVMQRVNSRLANVEKIRRFAIAPEFFTVENEQMTPTLKVRRHVLNEIYKDVIEGLY